jgi:hypothetical protein
MAASTVLYACNLSCPATRDTVVYLLGEGGWDGSSTGVGGACFWLFVVNEVLTCLPRNQVVSLSPDEWAIDMKMTMTPRPESGQRGTGGSGSEHEHQHEIWVRRIFCVLAKVAYFRATEDESKLGDQKHMSGERLPAWRGLEKMCWMWNKTCPRTMKHLVYVEAAESGTNSLFPYIWYVRSFTYPSSYRAIM